MYLPFMALVHIIFTDLDPKYTLNYKLRRCARHVRDAHANAIFGDNVSLRLKLVVEGNSIHDSF